MKLFVYGTLQKGWGNNVLLSGAKFMGDAVTKKSYCLLDVGCPIASNSELFEKLPITGQVFEINEKHLERCDRLEGHPDWYIRREVSVMMVDSQEELVSYIYEMDTAGYSRASRCSVVTIDNNRYYRWR